MTGGGSSIPAVQSLLRVLAAGRDVAELGSALRDRRLVATEILRTPHSAAIVAVRR